MVATSAGKRLDQGRNTHVMMSGLRFRDHGCCENGLNQPAIHLNNIPLPSSLGFP